MSEFDKEAEREKLREKYGDEPADREATERMSDLLLKGATMTNRHCSECGDPIFRHDGQAFCPTCQRPVGTSEEAEAATAEGTEADGESPPEASAPGDTATSDRPSMETDPEPAAEANGGAAGAAEPSPVGGEADRTEPTRRSASPTVGQAGGSGEQGDLGAAEASLSRQVADLAATAEAADDLARRRDLLAATREAAEALAAVRQATGR